MPGGWAGSTRRATLPPNWRTVIRPAVLTRDPVCTCSSCPRCTPTGCERPSTDADHLGKATDHRLEMLAGKCGPCHGHKTSRQGSAARWSARARRAPERPPGLL